MAVFPKRSTAIQTLNLTNTNAGTYISAEVSILMGASVIACQAVFVRGEAARRQMFSFRQASITDRPGSISHNLLSPQQPSRKYQR